jgi:hypothetical protein
MGRRPLLQAYYPKFPILPGKTLSSYLHHRTFQRTFKSATSMRRIMRAGVDQGGHVSHLLFSLYVNMLMASRHIELALFADDRLS